MNLSIGLSLTRPSGPLGFNPASLFASGEEGAWYDPSDLTTLYQDAAGTTPVTAAGQPVGLMLDKSKGLTLGSELVTNGTFDTNADWTGVILGDPPINQWGVTGGILRGNRPAGAAIVTGVTPVAGKYYQVEFDITSYTRGRLILTVGGVSVEFDSAGSFSAIIKAAGSPTNDIRLSGQSLFEGDIDNISVRELPGNHATQSTPTARPTLQTSGGLYYLDFDGADDFLRTATFASAQAQPNTISAALKDDSGTSTIYAWDGISQRQGLLHLTTHIYILGSATLLQAANARDTLDYVATAYYNTTSSEIRKNGASVATGNVGTNTWDGITLGSSITPSAFWNGRIYGFVGVNRTMTAGEIDGVESYLAAKSGVTL